MKLVCLGDSLTWGGYGGSYVEELRRLMPEHEIINAGEGGNTVVNLLRRLNDEVLSHQPDGVFVLVGGNDAISSCQPKTRSYYRQGQGIDDGEIDLHEFETSYRALLTELQQAHVLAWVGLPPIEYSPVTVETLKTYNERAAQVAQSLNVPVLDLLAALNPPTIPERPELDISFILTIGAREKRGWTDYESARAEGNFTYTFDGLHFTPEGARKAAELIAAFIREES